MIIPLHLTIELVSCFYNLISLHSSSSSWVPILVSDPLWTIKSFVGLLSDSVLHIWSPCEFFPWYIMPLLSCFLCLANHALLSGLCYLLLKLVVYVSKKPLWVEHMPSLNRVNPKVFTNHTLLVPRQIKFSTLQLHLTWEVNGRLYIEEVGVDLELVFMPMDTM